MFLFMKSYFDFMKTYFDFGIFGICQNLQVLGHTSLEVWLRGAELFKSEMHLTNTEIVYMFIFMYIYIFIFISNF